MTAHRRYPFVLGLAVLTIAATRWAHAQSSAGDAAIRIQALGAPIISLETQVERLIVQQDEYSYPDPTLASVEAHAQFKPGSVWAEGDMTLAPFEQTDSDHSYGDVQAIAQWSDYVYIVGDPAKDYRIGVFLHALLYKEDDLGLTMPYYSPSARCTAYLSSGPTFLESNYYPGALPYNVLVVKGDTVVTISLYCSVAAMAQGVYWFSPGHGQIGTVLYNASAGRGLLGVRGTEGGRLFLDALTPGCRLVSVSGHDYSSLPGDVNTDGVVGIPDAVDVLRSSAGLGDPAPAYLSDTAPYPSEDPRGYGDGRVDLQDVLRLLRHMTGLDNNLPWTS